MRLEPQRGDFVRVRSRRWLVEDEPAIDGLRALRLACVDDDAQGEVTEVLWDAEIDGEILGDEGWASVARLGTDDPSTFAAYLRTLRWNTATASDRDLFQAPFRAGIHLDAYQLLPLARFLEEIQKKGTSPGRRPLPVFGSQTPAGEGVDSGARRAVIPPLAFVGTVLRFDLAG
jgi:hypothetical protein